MVILDFTTNPAYNFFISEWIHTSSPMLIGLSLIALLRN